MDTKVYSTIAQQNYPELIFVPSDSRADLENFDKLNENVLNRTLWGVQFFMLTDRDATVSGNDESTNFRVLPRYHLENYFLDCNVLSSCFEGQEDVGSWLLDPTQIEEKLHSIASKKVGYAASLIAASKLRRSAGNVSLMPNGVHEMGKDQLIEAACLRAREEASRLKTVLDPDDVAKCFEDAYDSIFEKLNDGGTRKIDIPAKAIFFQFCSAAKIPPGRLKNLYIAKALQNSPETFQDISDILASFSAQ